MLSLPWLSSSGAGTVRSAQQQGWLARRPGRQAGCRAAGDDAQSRLSQAPWSLTFDLRERETLWTEENQARLVKIVASYELGLEQEDVDRRLRQLLALLPGLQGKLAYIKPSLLAGLLRDPPALLDKLLALKALLPGVDVGRLVVAQPHLLLQEVGEVEAELQRLRAVLGREDIDQAIEANPRMLDAEAVSEVLEELRRLMPRQDPVDLLLADPSWLLRVERGSKRLGQSPDEPC